MRMDADLWDLGWANRDSRPLKVYDPNGTVMLFSWCVHNSTGRTTVCFFDISRTLMVLGLFGRSYM